MRLYGCIDTVDTCVIYITLGSQIALVNKSRLATICLTILTLKCAQVLVFLANQQSEPKMRVTLKLHTGTGHAHAGNFNALFLRYGKLLQ